MSSCGCSPPRLTEAAGHEARLDDGWGQARLFYASYVAVAVAAAGLVPVLWVIGRVARDRALMGDHVLSRTGAVLTAAAFAGLAACVLALGGLSL